MNYVLSFLFAGLVGLVGQMIYLLVGKKMPPALFILFGLGALLSGLGAMDWVGAQCPGAMVGMLMNGGTMFFNAGLMAFSGDPSLLLVIWLIIIVMMLLGIVAGALRHRSLAAKQEDTPRE